VFLERSGEWFLAFEELSLLIACLVMCQILVKLVLTKVPNHEIAMAKCESLCLINVVQNIAATAWEDTVGLCQYT
jgi:hypothetical protein